jgi:hypothetical protein
MLLADNHSIAEPGLCPSSIAPFSIAILLNNIELTTIYCNLNPVAGPAGYPYQLLPLSIPIY